MDPGRPKQPTGAGGSPGQPALETVVRAHSDQLGKLNTELSSAFGQVTGEMGTLRTSVTSLSSQVAALTDLVTRLLPSRAGEINPTPPAAPSTAPPTVPPELLPDPRWEPTLSPPHSYAGEFDRCRGFLGQCELLFTHQASRYRTDGARVALIMSSLAGRALDWAVAAVGRNPRLSSCLPDFLEEFRRVFDHPSQGADAAGRLHSLQQGSRGVADYTLEFRTLAAESGWDDAALRSAYRRGLSEELKDLLVRDHPSSLNELSTLAHRLDDRLRERRLERAQRRETPGRSTPIHLGTSPLRHQASSVSPASGPGRVDRSGPPDADEPMQLGRSRLSPGVREQRFRERLCLYCGGEGHQIRTCPVRPKDPAR